MLSLIDGLIYPDQIDSFSRSDWRSGSSKLIVLRVERSQVSVEKYANLKCYLSDHGRHKRKTRYTVEAISLDEGVSSMGINQIRSKPLCRTSFLPTLKFEKFFISDQITREKKLRSSSNHPQSRRLLYWSEDDGGRVLFQAVRWASIAHEGWDTFNRTNTKTCQRSCQLNWRIFLPSEQPSSLCSSTMLNLQTASGPRNLSRFWWTTYVAKTKGLRQYQMNIFWIHQRIQNLTLPFRMNQRR